MAGLAWRLFRHPPIATALVAGGLYALGKTDRYDVSWSAPKLMETVQDKVSGAAQSVSETAHDLADQAYQKMTDAKDAVAETISPGGQMPQAYRDAAPQPLDAYLLATAALALGAAVAMAQTNR